ncbi:MAG: hypothetical protein HGB17_12545, partial [Syntrophobacteraceae bacterium]|nr:hypothetical protein [Syntrophobacteraceae bacterium]
PEFSMVKEELLYVRNEPAVPEWMLIKQDLENDPLQALFIRPDLDLAEYTPNEVKQAVTGYGAAAKRQVQEMVRILLNLPEIPRPDTFTKQLWELPLQPTYPSVSADTCRAVVRGTSRPEPTSYSGGAGPADIATGGCSNSVAGPPAEHWKTVGVTHPTSVCCHLSPVSCLLPWVVHPRTPVSGPQGSCICPSGAVPSPPGTPAPECHSRWCGDRRSPPAGCRRWSRREVFRRCCMPR